MPQPLALTDDQMCAILVAAQPIDVDLREPFLQTVANLLAGEPAIGDGAVARACREAQRQFFEAPDLSRSRDTSRWR